MSPLIPQIHGTAVREPLAVVRVTIDTSPLRQSRLVCVRSHFKNMRLRGLNNRNLLFSCGVLLVAAAYCPAPWLDDFKWHGAHDLSCSLDSGDNGNIGGCSTAQFFEGWYYKFVTRNGDGVAVIPGVYTREPCGATAGCVGEAFVHVVDGARGDVYYYKFDPKEISFDEHGGMSIGDAVRWSMEGVNLRLEDTPGIVNDGSTEAQAPLVSGHVSIHSSLRWPFTWLSPGAMGWFGWMPFMQCYHGVESMRSTLSGSLSIDYHDGKGVRVLDFDEGNGYIEKDWGVEFPHSWVWMQTNDFAADEQNPKGAFPVASVFVSVASIPWMGSQFPGFIMGLQLGNQLYRFATYTGASLYDFRATQAAMPGDACTASFNVSGISHRMEVVIRVDDAQRKSALLHAPRNGKMLPITPEALTGVVNVRLMDAGTDELVWAGVGRHAGVEVIGDVGTLATQLHEGVGVLSFAQQWENLIALLCLAVLGVGLRRLVWHARAASPAAHLAAATPERASSDSTASNLEDDGDEVVRTTENQPGSRWLKRSARRRAAPQRYG